MESARDVSATSFRSATRAHCWRRASTGVRWPEKPLSGVERLVCLLGACRSRLRKVAGRIGRYSNRPARECCPLEDGGRGLANLRAAPCPLAGRQGVEPRLSGSEPLVLPLNDLPVLG